MKISFVIPAYNEAKMVGKCLQSVFAEIERTRKAGEQFEAEVVVVDNASTDKTREEALKFPNVTVVRENLKGLVYARRAGWVATSGDLVANIDADTMLPAGWLSKAIKAFSKDKNLVALSGPYIYYDLSVFWRAWVKAFYFPGWFVNLFTQRLFGRATMLQGGNFVLRRTAWDQAGGFDISISFYGEDADVARRICKQGRVLWSWRFPIYSSGRRLQEEGVIKTALLYTLNLFAVHLSGRPATRHYTDVRPE